MEKYRKRSVMIMVLVLVLFGCNSRKTVPFHENSAIVKAPSVVKTYEVTDPGAAFESDELVTMVRYFEMSDGSWKTDSCTYKYRLEITGRMGNADQDTIFVFLSNIKEITFDQAWKESRLSSNMGDYITSFCNLGLDRDQGTW